MKSKSREKSRTITILVIFAGVIFFLEAFGVWQPLIRSLQKAATPLQIGLYKTKIDIRNFLDTWVKIGQLAERERQLSFENATLTAENAALKKLGEENLLLREQLGVKTKEQTLIVATVVGSDPVLGSSGLVVDKGTSDGVKKFSLVILKNILIGQITQAGPATSIIKLLNHPDTKIPAVTDGGVKGLLEGEFGNQVILNKVIQNASLKPGELVFSSGEGGIPAGFVLGKISKVRVAPAALFQSAVVESLVSYESLETVFILKESQ